MFTASDLNHVIDSVSSIAQSPLMGLLRSALDTVTSKRSMRAAKRQEQSAKLIADAIEEQTRANNALAERVAKIKYDLEEQERKNGARYEHLVEVLAKWSEPSPDSLLGMYRTQQLMQMVEAYELAKACAMSHEAVLEQLDTIVDLPAVRISRDSTVTLQHVKRLSAEQQKFDQGLAQLYDVALDGAPQKQRQRLERVVSSTEAVSRYAAEVALEPTILILPATASMTSEFREAFLEALGRVTATHEKSRHDGSTQHNERSARSGRSRTSPRLLVAPDLLRSGLTLDNNAATRLHKVLGPFSVICIQPSSNNASLRLETWSWLRGDSDPTEFARIVSLPDEESHMLDVRPEWLLAAFGSWLTVLLCSALSAMGYEGVTFLSVMRPLQSSMAERLAFSAVTKELDEEFGKSFASRYGNLGLAHETSDVAVETSSRLSSEVTSALRAAGWEGHNLVIEDGVLWITITKPYSNDALVVALPEQGQYPIRVRCWRIDARAARNGKVYHSDTVTKLKASAVTLSSIDHSFPEYLNRRVD